MPIPMPYNVVVKVKDDGVVVVHDEKGTSSFFFRVWVEHNEGNFDFSELEVFVPGLNLQEERGWYIQNLKDSEYDYFEELLEGKADGLYEFYGRGCTHSSQDPFSLEWDCETEYHELQYRKVED